MATELRTFRLYRKWGKVLGDKHWIGGPNPEGLLYSPISAGLRNSQSVVRDRDETQEGCQKCQEDSVQLLALTVEEGTLESGNVSGFRKLKSGNRFSRVP